MSQGDARPMRWLWSGRTLAAWLGAFGLAAGAALAEAPGPPERLRVLNQTEHYVVDAPSVELLRAQLLRRGSRDGHGLTTAELELRLQVTPAADGCHFDDFQLDLKTRVLLPDWQPPARPTSEQTRRWSEAYSELLAHEETHRRHAQEAAQWLLTDLLGRRGAHDADCITLADALQQRHRVATSRLRVRDELFDQITGARPAEPQPPSAAARR